LTVIDPAPAQVPGTPAHTPSAREHATARPARRARARRYLLCPPRYFEVGYAINPWMDPVGGRADAELALRQWESLRTTYLGLGHEVELIDPVPGLPDMVFAANGALVVGTRALGASFAHPERQDEAGAYRRRLEATSGVAQVVAPQHVNEGEGDFLVVGDVVLAGTGFRTDPAAHAEVEQALALPVVSLTLVDPRYYHLDTAIGVLDDQTIAYYPPAFDEQGQQTLATLFPEAVVATEEDAATLGLNLVSDGHNVVLPAAATALAERLAGLGFAPHPVDLSELLKAGGSVKCCTMELHRHRSAPTTH
jgi:N-dimethylarginine dimethylaminohydrolase